MTASLVESVPFAYQTRFSKRRTLGLYVYPDGRVEVRAPLGCPEAVVAEFVAKKSAWVQRKLVEFSKRPPVIASFDIRQPQPYLGVPYPVQLLAERPFGVWFAADRLLLRCRTDSHGTDLLVGWYRRQAQGVFAERLRFCQSQLAHFNLPEPTLRLRRMRRRWGSCSSNGVITLNVDLVRYSQHLIDYVVVHELCHLREFNHSPAFYRLMDEALPDWRKHRDELQQLAMSMPPWPE